MRAMAIKSRRKMANPIGSHGKRGTIRGANSFARSMQMMDVIMIALGLAFFAVSIAYTFACDRL
jgi:hypothetical protein